MCSVGRSVASQPACMCIGRNEISVRATGEGEGIRYDTVIVIAIDII